MTNDEASVSSLRLESAGEEKLASEYEQFMKMVSDIPVPTSVTEVTEIYSPMKNSRKSVSPHSYHEFNIESNLEEDKVSIETLEKEELEEKDKMQNKSIKSMECEVSIVSPDCQIQISESSIRTEHTPNNDGTEDSKSIPSDWENVIIKVERLSDENTDPREAKKKKKKKEKKVMYSSDSISSSSSSDTEREKKKKKKRKRKVINNSSSSDSDSTDSSSSSSSSSSDSSSSDEKRKRKRKKKIGKKRKKARRAARAKKKRRRKMSSDSSSSESDERAKKKKKKTKKKAKEAKQFDAKSINNGDINKVMSKSPVMASSSVVPMKKIKEEVTMEGARVEQSARKSINTRDNECGKQKKDRKESKSVENFMEEWEVDSMIATQQNEGDTSSQDHIEELEKMSDSDKHRRKRKQSRDNVKQDKDRSCKSGESGKGQSDEEVDIKRKRRQEKDVRSSTEFFADWERENERITQQIMQNETKYPRKSEKHKKEKWRETDFDTLNVPSLTQLEKEVCRKLVLADEWEVDSLEAIPELTSKRKNSQNTIKKMKKEIKYDKKMDTYITIEKETTKEKKKQERFSAIRIWEEEQEEGEREEMMLLEQKNKRKRDDWDIEEESFLQKSDEEMEIRKVDEIIKAEKEWNKLDDDTSAREDVSKSMMKLEPIGSKRVKKSRWDMGSQSEEKLEVKDIWEEDYIEWSRLNKCEQKLRKTEKETPRRDYSESSSSKSDLIDFYHKKAQNSESLERSWASEEMASRLVQAKKAEENSSTNNLIIVSASKGQTTSIKKDHSTTDHFKGILELDVKFKEKAIELYSPTSPALSQKSQVLTFG